MKRGWNSEFGKQLFTLSKVTFYKEFFECGQIIIMKLGKGCFLVGSLLKASKQEQNDM